MRAPTALALVPICLAAATAPAQQRATPFGLPTANARRGVVDPITGEALLPSASSLPRRDWAYSRSLGAWQPRMPSPTMPTASGAFSLVADTLRNRVVMFGGSTDGSFSGNDETWEWDGADWQRIQTTSQPSPRTAAAACFDATRGRLVLFGGLHAGSQLQDTWEYDGTQWFSHTTFRRPAAGAARLAFDPQRGVSVLRGANGTWEWDGTHWRGPLDRTPIPLIPSVDVLWDGATGSIVTTTGGGRLEAWDGTTWTSLANNAPQLRITTVLSLPGNAGLLAVTVDTRTWIWDGNAWQQRGSPGAAPGYGTDRMVYDSNRDRLLLLGFDGAVFTFDQPSNCWRELSSGAGALVRGNHFCVTFDAARDRLVAFGSTGSAPNLGTTWLWDPVNDWQSLHHPNRPTGVSQGMSMDYDPVRRRCVLFGGVSTLNTTNPPVWEWDGTDWHRIDPASGPDGRENAVLAFDSDREVMVMVGNGTTDLWDWDGTAWMSRGVLETGGATVWKPAVYHAARRRMQVVSEARPSYHPTVFEIDLESGTWARVQILDDDLDAFRSGNLWNLAYAPTTDTTWMVHSSVEPVRALSSAYPARADRFGASCNTSSGSRPEFFDAPTRRPWIGDRFGFEITDLAPTTRFATLLLGASDVQWAGGALPFDLTPFGMTGCVLRASSDIIVPLQAQGGRIADDLPIPNEAALVGNDVFLQAVAVDHTANPAGVITTNALRLQVGRR